MRQLMLIALAGMLPAGSPASAEQLNTPTTAAAVDPALATVLADPRRGGDRARDAWRHPAETLAFFQVKPGMTVVDYMPSGGWYTRILAPYVGASGRYIGVNPPAAQSMERLGGMAESFPAKASGWTGIPTARILAANSDALPVEWNGTVDRFLIFREMHNLKRWGIADQELKRAHALLKPDGMLGIVQHRAKDGAPDAYVDGSKGYLKVAQVIAMAEAAGFELAGESAVNANPKDSADWPQGVWTLPPNYALKDVDRTKYEAVGESDRMTLLFRKKGS